jgi:hypothetical protein
MTSTARTSVSALPRGHAFTPARFTVTSDDARAYLAAVGDRQDYGDVVPPLAAVALGLAALQEQLALPEGSLHTGQEVEHLAAIRAGDVLSLTGSVVQRSERQGFVISVLEFQIATTAAAAIRARTTIMAPGAGT